MFACMWGAVILYWDNTRAFFLLNPGLVAYLWPPACIYAVKLFYDIKIMTTQLTRWLLHISLEGGNPHNVGTALSSHHCFRHYTCPLVLWVLQKEHALYVICTFHCDKCRHLKCFCLKYNPYLSPDSVFVFKDHNLVTRISLSAAGVFSFPL